jgi:hypothetical protein
MKKIIMLVGLACGALVADAMNVTLDLTPIKSAWELRRERTEEMRKALRIDEAKREALRYERRKRILNKAAEDLQRLFNASNKIVKVEFDFAAGDVKVVYADAEGWQYPYLQRIQPLKKTPPRKIKPKVKEKNDVR